MAFSSMGYAVTMKICEIGFGFLLLLEFLLRRDNFAPPLAAGESLPPMLRGSARCWGASLLKAPRAIVYGLAFTGVGVR
jgi:hypothetical protein